MTDIEKANEMITNFEVAVPGTLSTDDIAKLVCLAIAQERDACAKLADADEYMSVRESETADQIAAAIRKRGEE